MLEYINEKISEYVSKKKNFCLLKYLIIHITTVSSENLIPSATMLVKPLKFWCKYETKTCSISSLEGSPRGVMVKAMDCGIAVTEFVLQSRYYVHFRANTLEKGMNPLILPTMG